MSDDESSHSFEVELDTIAERYIRTGYAPGLAFGVTDASGYHHGGGYGTYNDSGDRPTVDTVFPIASMSKNFFACAAVLANDEGKLSLTDPITEYVPEFTIAHPTEAGVPTIEMLLSMLGGFTEDNAWIDPFISRPMSEVLEHISSGIHLSFPPGTAFEYSNIGYALAALAVSRAVGKPIMTYVRERFLEPLGMRSTFGDGDIPDSLPRAAGFHRYGAEQWVSYKWQVSDGMIGACGLTSSVRDLATWITWLGSAFRPGPQTASDEILSKQSRRNIQRIRTMYPPTLSAREHGGFDHGQGGYALGLAVGMDVSGGLMASHNGGLPGYSLSMAWRPLSGCGSIVLTNSSCREASRLCLDNLARVTAHENAPAMTFTLWPETMALLKQADQLIRKWDDSLAVRIFADNVDFDRPLTQRRTEIEENVMGLGALLDHTVVVGAASPADVTWLVQGEHGAMICRIHVTPLNPIQIQTLTVMRIRPDQTWVSALNQIGTQHPRGLALVPGTNVSARLPTELR